MHNDAQLIYAKVTHDLHGISRDTCMAIFMLYIEVTNFATETSVYKGDGNAPLIISFCKTNRFEY